MEGLGGLDSFTAAFLILQLAYTAIYLAYKTQRSTAVRSVLWAVSVGLCLCVVLKAAKALGGRFGDPPHSFSREGSTIFQP
jgi:uncharacterized MAPEG superfamily protein